MQESNTLKVGGAVTYWRLAKFIELKGLVENLTDYGYNKFAPSARTPSAALRDALEEVFSTRKLRVEPLKDKNAFEIIEIERGEERNYYRHHMWVGIDKLRQIEVKPYAYDTANHIMEAYNKHLGLVRASAVTQSLLAILAHLNGCALKQGGHVYWLPADSLVSWRVVGRAVEGAPKHGGTSGVYLLQHQFDAESVKAVKDGIVEEIRAEAERMHEEILSNKLGEKALEFRKEELARLGQKIGIYEGLLDTGLDSLKQHLDTVEQGACAATLLLSSGAARDTVGV